MTLAFQNITHSYGNHTVLKNLNIEARAGDITCLFGGSGCGKSTLLRIAAGIENLQQGEILLDGVGLVSPKKQPPPEKRPIGLMFQENALFPNMTISDNIAFGLKHIKGPEKEALVAQWLEVVGLAGFGARYPHTLSGGQIQRVAMARSLAPNPKVLLMDEPFASIDNILRRQLREMTRTLLKKTQSTVLFVTHDPLEALEIADVIAVMEGGVIVQCDVPQKLYEQPKTMNVASLFGESLLIKARKIAEGFDTAYGVISSAGLAQPSAGDDVNGHQNSVSDACTLAVRPEGLAMKRRSESCLKVVDIRFVGQRWLVYLLPEDAAPGLQPLRVATDDVEGVELGDGVTVHAKPQDFFVFDLADE
ncbi:Fe(3+) ions import ATP-binding protein FbpC [Thalassocella blandensis]|nr:Fe(3+) ions import ATP-binding protein FbpC [Thalassocella blandensis]